MEIYGGQFRLYGDISTSNRALRTQSKRRLYCYPSPFLACAVCISRPLYRTMVHKKIRRASCASGTPPTKQYTELKAAEDFHFDLNTPTRPSFSTQGSHCPCIRYHIRSERLYCSLFCILGPYSPNMGSTNGICRRHANDLARTPLPRSAAKPESFGNWHLRSTHYSHRPSCVCNHCCSHDITWAYKRGGYIGR